MDHVDDPMDLSTMEKKLSRNKYQDPEGFIADMTLMFNNSFCYNSRDSKVSELATAVEVEKAVLC